MPSDRRPVLIAYDGSPELGAAVRSAPALFPGRRLIVVAVWETALATASSVSLRSASAEMAAEAARVRREQTADTARAGAQLALELGGVAQSSSVTDQADVLTAIAAAADRHDASAVVVGSRGLERVKAPLPGSTSQGLLRRTQRPCWWSARRSKARLGGGRGADAHH